MRHPIRHQKYEESTFEDVSTLLIQRVCQLRVCQQLLRECACVIRNWKSQFKRRPGDCSLADGVPGLYEYFIGHIFYLLNYPRVSFHLILFLNRVSFHLI